MTVQAAIGEAVDIRRHPRRRRRLSDRFGRRCGRRRRVSSAPGHRPPDGRCSRCSTARSSSRLQRRPTRRSAAESAPKHPGKARAAPAFAEVDAARVAAVRLGESRAQAIGAARHQDQVDVIVHQAPGEAARGRRLAGCGEKVEASGAVRFRPECRKAGPVSRRATSRSWAVRSATSTREQADPVAAAKERPDQAPHQGRRHRADRRLGRGQGHDCLAVGAARHGRRRIAAEPAGQRRERAGDVRPAGKRPADTVGTAQSLIANGCDNQLDVLVETAPSVD